MSADEWSDPSSTLVRSESRPEWYRRKLDGFSALAKNNDRRGDGIARAAHEKISADLAYLMGFPVPPVQLWDRGQTGLYSLSAAAFQQVTPLTELAIGSVVPDDLKEEILPYVEWSRAFHFWIQDEDRKADHILVNLEPSNGQADFAFIDHAFSLSKRWEEADADELSLEDMEEASGTDYIWKAEPDLASRSSACEAILGIDDMHIREIVGRVPARFLSVERKSLIIGQLLTRQRLLEKWL